MTTTKDRSKGDEMSQQDRWENEHIDISGHLHVPVSNVFDRAPGREGWVPFFVSVHADRTPPKHHIYKRVEVAA